MNHRTSFPQHLLKIVMVAIYLIVTIGLLYYSIRSSTTAHASVEGDYKVFLPIISSGLSQSVNPPTITSFTANPAVIAPGGKSTLSWNVTGAANLSIAPGNGTVTGTSIQVSPTATTKYTLSASNSGGTVSADVWVTVQGPVENPPVINNFQATPSVISPGGKSTLSWNVTGATSLSITPGVGTVTGTSVQVSPTATTKYTLSASNSKGTVTANVWVTVQEPEGGQGFFLPGIPDIDGPTSHPTVAIDPANGVHVTFTPESNPASNPARSAYYAYCPSNCTSANAFTITLLRQSVYYANLALDSAGHPRILLTAGISDNIPHYEYGTCDLNCTSPGQWTFTTLTYFVPSPVWGVEFSQRFALDSQGHPRFVYQDQLEEHAGNFYGYCNNNCHNLANWYDVQLGADFTASGFALALSPSGQPRVLWNAYDSENILTYLRYLECDQGCEDFGNWREVPLLDTVSASVEEHASYDIKTNSSGRPRILYYTGTGSGGTLPPNILYYLACDPADCTQLGNWSVVDLNFPYFHGEEGVSLAFDAQGRPRIAYHAQITAGFGLYYAWCNTNCANSAADWHTQEVEPSESVDQELPIPPQDGCPFPLCNPPVPPCTLSFWDTGVRPSIALDSAGNPRIAYDADHNQGGGCPPHSDTRLTRFILFPHP